MIKIENTEVLGWEHAIRGMRNPMNSWEKSDSAYCAYSTHVPHCSECSLYEQNCHANEEDMYTKYIVGTNDHDLMMRLAKAGTDHRKFMRMITVYVDVTAPMYWWKEFDTYKVGTVRNSCSTMHKIHEKEFELDDFSHEHLLNIDDKGGPFDYPCVIRDPNNRNELTNYECVASGVESLELTIGVLNTFRKRFLRSNNKDYWWQMIQLLPSSYNQRATLMLNYEVLANIYKSRKNHKLDEWREFCTWIESLPYSEIITGSRE